MAKRTKKSGTGHCPECGYGVFLGADNRVLAHYTIRHGKVVGRCQGRGRRVEPERVAIYRPTRTGKEELDA